MSNSSRTIEEIEKDIAAQFKFNITCTPDGITKQEFSKAIMDAANKKINEWREDTKESKPE